MRKLFDKYIAQSSKGQLAALGCVFVIGKGYNNILPERCSDRLNTAMECGIILALE